MILKIMDLLETYLSMKGYEVEMDDYGVLIISETDSDNSVKITIEAAS